MRSQEGPQQGDLSSMLLLSLAIQPAGCPESRAALVSCLSRHCRLALNRWYADDSTLVGPIDEVLKALTILRHNGPASGFYLNISKCRAYRPTTTPANLSRLLKIFPLHSSRDGGLVLLGAPLGTDAYIRQHLNEVHSCQASLRLLDDIPDPRSRFHLNRVTCSACILEHVLALHHLFPSQPLFNSISCKCLSILG